MPDDAHAPVQTTEALAQRLGLSRWTISRALNGQPGVSKATRERVAQAMAETGFAPSSLARGLRGGKTGTVGCIFQEIESPSLAKKTAALQSALHQAGQRGVITLTDGDASRERDAIQHLLGWQVDGLVIVNATFGPESATARTLQAAPISTVLIDPAHPLPFATVRLDRIHAIREIIKFLHQKGHTAFCLAGFPNDRYFATIRRKAVAKGARDCNLDLERDFITIADPHFEDQDYHYGEALADQYAALQPRPRAVIALNDRIAIGMLKALAKRHALQAPGDFVLVGFDDLDVAAWTTPSLTTVNQQIPLVMQTAVSLLASSASLPAAERAQEHLIRPVFKQRGSTST